MYKLGIIGFGVVGKSVLAFLNRQHAGCTREHDLFDESIDPHCLKVFVWDSRNLVSVDRRNERNTSDCFGKLAITCK